MINSVHGGTLRELPRPSLTMHRHRHLRHRHRHRHPSLGFARRDGEGKEGTFIIMLMCARSVVAPMLLQARKKL